MRMAVDSGYLNLWLEGDSLNIINMLNNKSSVTWIIEGSMLENKNLMNKFDNVLFSHLFWEGNSVDD